METSTTREDKPRYAGVVAKDTTRVGEAYKDYWAQRAREGDLQAPIKLAACYEMAGEVDNGLAIITDFLTRDDLPTEIQSEALLRKAVLQVDSPLIAWKTIGTASLEVEPELRWKLHNQRGRILKELKKFDSAIIEYTATAYYANEARSPQAAAIAHNNLASIYRIKKMYVEAHESVDRAISLLGTDEYLPHAYDQKALIYLDQKRYEDAYDCSVKAMRGTEDRHRWRVELLCTLAKAHAGLQEPTGAVSALQEAREISTYLDDQHLRLILLRASKVVYGMLYDGADEASVKLATRLSGGKLRQAAKKLGMAHSSLLKSMKKYSIRIEKL